MQSDIRGRCVVFGPADDYVSFSEVAMRAVAPPHPIDHRRVRTAAATIVATCLESVPAHDICRGVACDEPELPLSDVPLVVEDLLLLTRVLAESGAPTEAIEAILDHIAALREGRC